MSYNLNTRFYLGAYEFQPAMDFSTNAMGVRIVNTQRSEPMDVVTKDYAARFIQMLEATGQAPKPVEEVVTEAEAVVVQPVDEVNPKTGRRRTTKKTTVVGGDIYDPTALTKNDEVKPGRTI